MAPNTEYSGSRLSVRLNTDSYNATSITCPLPPRASRSYSASSSDRGTSRAVVSLGLGGRTAAASAVVGFAFLSFAVLGLGAFG